ncbi:MAG: AI-2E family transporter [Bacteroidales bacterium]|nr:AI-2E family transporter [Bacteroidales bacterium]
METNYREKLARLVMILIILGIVGAVCWYLRHVLVYIVLALVITVLALPMSRLYAKVRIGKFRSPAWLNSLLAILTVFTLAGSLFTLLAPLIRDVTTDISMANINGLTKALSFPLSSLNEWVRDVIPGVSNDFKIENVFLAELQKTMNAGAVTNVVGGITSFIATLGVTAFAVIFIAFFLLKDPSLFNRIVEALVPDSMEKRIHKSIHEIVNLIARYFVGVSIEVACVWLVNFIGLWAVAQMGFKYSISIAFLAGILNLIPYIGPLIGGVLGVSLSLIIHYAGTGLYGLDIAFFPFVLVLVGIFAFAQIIDNYILQPVIYSNSVKAHPLEIFIVFLIAAQMGGTVGMLAAVPFYTVLKVIAREFFSHIKPIRRLTSE